MEDMAEFYLASVWKYRDVGFEHVLKFLREKHPDSNYTYDHDEGWFRVNCSPSNVYAIQASFRDVHTELERGVPDPSAAVAGNTAGNAANPWLIEPSPSELTRDATPAKGPVVDHLCPVVFDRFAFNKVWARIKNETPDTITAQSFLGAQDRDAIMKLSGAHIELDPAGRLVFMGASTQECLGRASKMLDNLFRKFTFVLPPPKHMMWSESEGAYTVDARFMAHVNDGMLTSSIFDPGLYPGTRLDDMFKAVFGKAACLRICFYDRVKRIEVSYFGPYSQPIFNDQARKWPVWFKRAEYTPKIKGVTAPPKEDKVREKSSSNGHGHRHGNETEVVGDGESARGQQQQQQQQQERTQGLVCLSREIDLLTDDIPYFETEFSLAVKPPPIAPPMIVDAARATPSSPVPSPSNALVPVLDLDASKHGYQLKLLQQFLGDPFKKGSLADHKKKPPTPAKTDTGNEGSLISFGSDEVPLVDVGAPAVVAPARPAAPTCTQNTQNDQNDADQGSDLLIDVPAPPVPLTKPQPTSPRVAMATYRPSNSNALVRRSTFANSLCNCIGRLMGDLPYSRGRVRMQVELGRLYLMDTIPEGLASNLPGEPACGWPHTDIMGRLDTVCISSESVVFSKALTLFANDIESILGMPGMGGAPGVFGLGTGPDGVANIVDIETDTPPEWAFHDKRIVYELKCERRVVNNATGVVKVQSPFVVEIDGTMPGAFRYSLRRVDDSRPPIWIHCIQRSWDARVVVSYSHTDKLEAEYGEFARELLRTMVVPPGPMINPRFQMAYDDAAKQHDGQSVYTKVQSARVRNVGRFVSANGESYLDVSWNRHMRMETKADRVKKEAGGGESGEARESGELGEFGESGESAESEEKGTLRFTGAEDDQTRGMFGSWYEASVLSAAAEHGFRENETLPVGGMACWGRSVVAMDNMYEAAFGPALRLVQKMDGVGVLIDNGQGEGKQPVPPMKTRRAVAVKNFW
ncbi:hypothetical protein F503_07040 [Ophiostoma piceae UAMH 11346]|uniref:Uncharacterized protein n=1 Tax=Ophiostoma piceae (strain UAMH 11346) TaxID=1262450 RepID=S3C6X7_OPHP1|nr:hypothetical protein F503_07040 [Ophiostoma piceae UAMH 11346]